MNILKSLFGEHPVVKRILDAQEKTEARLTPLTGVIAPLSRPAQPERHAAKSVDGALPAAPEVRSGSLVEMIKTAQAETALKAQEDLARERARQEEQARRAAQEQQDRQDGGLRRRDAQIRVNIQAVPATNTALPADWSGETRGPGATLRMKVWWGVDTVGAPDATVPEPAAAPGTVPHTTAAQAPAQHTPEDFLTLLDALSTPSMTDEERLRENLATQGQNRIHAAKARALEQARLLMEDDAAATRQNLN